MDAIDGRVGEVADVMRLSSHQPMKAIEDANDLKPLCKTSECGRLDDTVNAWSRPATDQDANFL